MPQKIDPKEQVVVPTAARKVLKGIFDGLDLLRDLEEEKRIERGRDIR
jgi:DNA-binding transcriptional regulator/RsmH inhibitor MraZ